MNMKASVHEAVVHLESSLAQDRDSAATSIRLLKLIARVVDQWHADDSLKDASALTDSELLERFVISGAVSVSLDSREQRKRDRRIAARLDFLAKLKDFGGLLKAKAVAELLGVSRQTVNNHISAGKLIALKEGNDHLIPGFQFDDNGKLKHLEEVLLLIQDASPEAKCSFFLNPIRLEGEKQELPYITLKEGASEQELGAIKREALQYLSQMAS